MRQCSTPWHSTFRPSNPLVTPIEYLKGVGPQRAQLLRSELNVHTYIDLLQHFPFRYVDRSKFHRVAELHEEMPQAQLRGVLGPLRTMGEKQGRRLTATFSIQVVALNWFGSKAYDGCIHR